MNKLSGACSCPWVRSRCSPALQTLVSPSSQSKPYLPTRAQLRSHLLHQFFPDDLCGRLTLLCQDFFVWPTWQLITRCLGTSTQVLDSSLHSRSDDNGSFIICAKMFTIATSYSSLQLAWSRNYPHVVHGKPSFTSKDAVKGARRASTPGLGRAALEPAKAPGRHSCSPPQRPSEHLPSQLHSLPFSFPSPLPFPCWSSLPLYQNPLGFTCSHKQTKEAKGLLTPLLGEELPLHLVRRKERKSRCWAPAPCKALQAHFLT